MIKSKLKVASGLSKLLSNPEELKKDVAKLEEKEKKVKAATKELYDGKSKKAFLDDLAVKVQDAEKRLADVEAECNKIMLEQKDTVESISKEMAQVEKGLKKKESDLKKKASDLSKKAKEIQQDEVNAEKARKVAEGEKAKYEKLRKQYEDKVADLKGRLSGLEG